MEKETNPLVKSKLIKSAALFKRLPGIQKHYNWPYLFIYPIWVYIYLAHYSSVFGSYEWTFLSIVTTVGSQILLMLMCQWDVSIKTLFTCVPVQSIYDAEVIRIIAAEHQGKNQICDIEFTKSKTKGSKARVSFHFQGLKFIYEEDIKEFKTVDYPCDSDKKISYFQNSQGLKSDLDIDEALYDFGDNKFTIPIPTFLDLFKEHAVAPFFVFQVFCVGLWCLDEYWYYPMFTLFMLVVFESTLVFQRVKTLNEFRSLSMSPFDVNVLRKGIWMKISTTELFPGDLISITRSEGESGVPCDVVLLDGSCIVNEAMLSGESTPQLKESIFLRDGDDKFDLEGTDKNSVLFGGTKVLQVDSSNFYGKIRSPDNGCICLVLRTGFGTSQGGLVRTMVHSTQQVSANNAESYIFILFLLMFAILAAGYVWVEGKKDTRRSKTKIILDCVLIITSVVPPELPMELSLAVNSSLVSLSKSVIFCTEPFRIPYAGKLDICCFDKTGTLTGEELVVDGIVGSTLDNGMWEKTAPDTLKQISTLGIDATLTLASSHALVILDDGTLVGDPMEKAQLESTGFHLDASSTITLPKKSQTLRLSWAKNLKITTCRRFPFSSVLKKSSSLVKLDWGFDLKDRRYLIGTKGAPEALRDKFVEIPEWYDSVYKNFSRRGGRVLALGSKWLKTDKDLSVIEINDLNREEMESGLTFQGFLVFSCPLKPDSTDVIKMLNQSQHRCIMITGDNALTAVHVAAQVEIVEKTVLILDINLENELECVSVDEKIKFVFDPLEYENGRKREIKNILEGWELCATGSALDRVADTLLWKEYLMHNIWVYARVSPIQKEFVLTEMKSFGYITLMCGDGTNDVGALKQSHVGVALLNGTEEDLKKISERMRIDRMKASYDAQVKLSVRFGQPVPPPPKILREHMEQLKEKEREKTGNSDQPSTSRSVANRKRDPNIAAQEKINDFLASLDSMEEEIPVIKFGDASVAAPFTSKLGSITSVSNIVRQGRSTLVATIQMYKILALNSLISAYSMSVLYLEGIKFGDYQATIMGIMMSVCFMCISKATSMEKLSRERPHSNILNVYVLLTVLGQFAIHIIALVYLTLQVRKYEAPGIVDVEGEFKPSLLNTAMYLISLSQQISTFAINYQGHPFRESLRENKVLYRGLLLVGAITVLCATESSRGLNDFMRLVEMPPKFRDTLCITIALDFYGSYIVEKLVKTMFSDNRPKDISYRPPPTPEVKPLESEKNMNTGHLVRQPNYVEQSKNLDSVE
ncbi:hypothetical protein BB559_001861 [Furculomyces boomerangus]|uniref:Cation-transporting P-type ATPase N-terminal domain-containing protein n=2 Tax=Harpellales TaxID=61421 RepID=A0A2T9Z013_9FUNG|nr:hypothetical protein BB559_001861 [Furculomyces boomerangus]PWA03478.1 hypothetical protein BB558_000347 [Smittium angustum]